MFLFIRIQLLLPFYHFGSSFCGLLFVACCIIFTSGHLALEAGEERPTAGDLLVMTHKCMFLWQHFSKVNTIQGRGNNSTCLLEINRNTPAAATLPVKKPEPT